MDVLWWWETLMGKIEKWRKQTLLLTIFHIGSLSVACSIVIALYLFHLMS